VGALSKIELGSTLAKKSAEFTIVPDSIDDHKLNAGAERTYRKIRALIENSSNGALDWPMRQIVDYLNVSESTYHNHRRQLERAGLLLVERRPRHYYHGDGPNIFRLADHHVRERMLAVNHVKH
jgi:DNA-binding transcriptional ArsR family regulator